MFLEVIAGEGFAQPSPRPMSPNPPGMLRIEPYSPKACATGSGGVPDRNATAAWAAEDRHQPDELHTRKERRERQAVPHPAGGADRGLPQGVVAAAGHPREPRVSVSRSIFALVDDRDRGGLRLGESGDEQDQIGFIDSSITRAIFGRSYAAEPDKLIEELRRGRGDRRRPYTLLLTVPNQLGVDYNAHVLESILDPRGAGARLALRRDDTCRASDGTHASVRGES